MIVNRDLCSVTVVVRGAILTDPDFSMRQYIDLRDRIESVISEYVVVVGTETISDAAVAEIVAKVGAHPEADLIYGDEVSITADGPVLLSRPDFSPERLRCQFYFGTVVAYRRELLAGIGGLRPELGAAALYDLALRASRADSVRVLHLHEVLLTGAAPDLGEIPEAGLEQVRTALTEHLLATGGGTVQSVSTTGVHRTTRPVHGRPLVSIVIPTRGLWDTQLGVGHSLVVDAVEGIVSRSTYDNLEIVVVYDTVADTGVLEALRDAAGDRLVLVEWTDSFNFSSKINLGVVHSRGDFLLILNDDVQLITPDWIERLLALAQLPGAGMSGCMLYYDDETIQHAGHHYWRGDATHIGMFVPRGDPGPLRGYEVEREVLGITAACAMMPRSVYYDVGGMSSLLPGAFNDVDLCMKVTTAGFGIYWTPHAELYHFESKTRDASVQKYEVDTAWGRWGSRMDDPRYWPYPV